MPIVGFPADFIDVLFTVVGAGFFAASPDAKGAYSFDAVFPGEGHNATAYPSGDLMATGVFDR
jgi:hypothetical protein